MIHDPKRTRQTPPGQSQNDLSGERVAKALARAGVASRRDVEKLIEAGRVSLNGQTLTTPAIKVTEGDVLSVDGEVVSGAEPARLFRYHKPVGLVTSHKDPQGRPTVFDALPPGLPRLISVGRLDLNTEGLLLLTNDGGLARGLELPATALVRRYRARAHGRITQDRLDQLKDGITVEGVHYGPIEAVLDKAKDGPTGSNLWITLTLAEGKNREVRRVLESLGLKVNRLIRLAYGPFALATLPMGAVEEVGPRVIREQLAAHIEPDKLPTGDRAQWRSVAQPVAVSGQRRLGGTRTVAHADPGLVTEKTKTVYKAGWAKPKPKTGHPTKSRPVKPGPASIGPKRSSGQRPRPAGAAEGGRTGAAPKGAGAHRQGKPAGRGPKART